MNRTAREKQGENKTLWTEPCENKSVCRDSRSVLSVYERCESCRFINLAIFRVTSFIDLNIAQFTFNIFNSHLFCNFFFVILHFSLRDLLTNLHYFMYIFNIFIYNKTKIKQNKSKLKKHIFFLFNSTQFISQTICFFFLSSYLESTSQ